MYRALKIHAPFTSLLSNVAQNVEHGLVVKLPCNITHRPSLVALRARIYPLREQVFSPESRLIRGMCRDQAQQRASLEILLRPPRAHLLRIFQTPPHRPPQG